MTAWAGPPAPAATIGRYLSARYLPRGAGTPAVKTVVCQVRPPSVLEATAGLRVTGSRPGTHRPSPAGVVVRKLHPAPIVMPAGRAGRGGGDPGEGGAAQSRGGPPEPGGGE